MVFIRAPMISETRPGVEVVARCQGVPVFVRQGKIMATTFHPELTQDTRVHQYFLDLISNGR
jgi:5'-phosphate synthase pdxT subunit